MTINDFENLFMFAGGLGIFLFGVHSMSGGVQKCAGEQMRIKFDIFRFQFFSQQLVL